MLRLNLISDEEKCVFDFGNNWLFALKVYR